MPSEPLALRQTSPLGGESRQLRFRLPGPSHVREQMFDVREGVKIRVSKRPGSAR